MMHIPLLSSLLGLGGAQPQPGDGGEKGDAFAQLLGLAPGNGAPVAGVAGEAGEVDTAATPAAKLDQVAAPAPLAPLEQNALHTELASAFAAAKAQPQLTQPQLTQPQLTQPLVAAGLPAQKAMQTSGKLVPHSGKTLPQTGKILPVAPPVGEAALPVAEVVAQAALPDQPDAATADTVAAEPARVPFAFADLALLQGWTNLDAAAPIVPPAPQRQVPASAQASEQTAGQPIPATDRQMAAALPLNLPQAQVPAGQNPLVQPALVQPAIGQPAARPEKQRTGISTALTSAIPATTGEAASAISIPLVRTLHQRAALAPVPDQMPAPIQQAASQLAEPASFAGANANAPAADQPAAEQQTAPDIELASVIDKLVLTRSQSREGRSEMHVPHPDFGRVTLALNLAGSDRLSLSMPDAPAELRQAVGQAFAPPPSRSEQAQTGADSTFGNPADTRADARSGDQRRDAGTNPQGRSEPPRPHTSAGRTGLNDQSTPPRRTANGRGVLA